jgi:hypothetical protein
MKNKTRLFFASASLLTVLLTVLHTLSLLTAYNTEVSYLDSPPLVITMCVLYAFGALWCLVLPLLLPKETPFAKERAVPHVAFGYLAAILLVLSGISLLLNPPAATGIAAKTLPALAVLTLLASAFFFVDAASKKRLGTVRAIFGFPVLMFLLCFLFYIYFNMYVTINSPLKNALQLSILSALLFMLCQIRSAISKPMPRIAIASRLLCALFCLPTAVSHLVFGTSELCGALEETVASPLLSLPLLAIGIFALSETIFYKD